MSPSIIPAVFSENGTLTPASVIAEAENATPVFDFLPAYSCTVARLSRWPLTGLLARYNLAINPRAHVDVTGWETSSWPGATRVTTVPGASLPSGADAAFYSGITDGGASLETDVQLLPPGCGAGDELSVQCEIFVVGAIADEAWLDISVSFPEYLGLTDELGALPLSDFVHYSGTVIVPEDSIEFAVYVTCNGLVEGGADTAEIYLTKLMVEAQPATGAYADGDSVDWTWHGTDHASVSSLRFLGTPGGIVSRQKMGTATVLKGNVDRSPTGVTSSETIGSASVLAEISRTLTGIATSEEIGSATTA